MHPSDDAIYLRWAQVNPSLLALLDSFRSTLSGTYRPALLLTWDGETGSGACAPAGIYFITANVGKANARKAIVLSR